MQAYKVYFLLALCVLIWSGNFVLARHLSTTIQPLELAFFRWLFTFILLLPAFYLLDIKKLIRVYKQNFLIMSILAFLGITLYNTIVYFAVQTTSATNGLLLNSIVPIMILILSSLILKTKIYALQVLGIFISTFGVLFLVLKGNIASLLNVEFAKGDLLIILSSFTWALYSVLIKFKPKELSNFELFASFVIIGFIILMPVYFYQGYELQSQIMLIKQNFHFLVYISLLASILCYYLWSLGIDTIGPTKTGQFPHLMPIFGSILAFIFLGERLAFYHIIGAILIAIGIYLSLFVKKSKA